MSINDLFTLGWNHFFQSQLTLDSLETELPFRVISVQRNLIQVTGFDQNGMPATMELPTYHWRNDPPENHPTVGDWLMCSLDLEPLYLLERKTLIKRRAAGRESLVQLIAANIDTLFIVTSCNEEFNLNRIERYLALAADSHIDAVIMLSKVDLCPDTAPYVDAIRQSNPLIPVESVNALNPESVATLNTWFGTGQTVALVGSSGVGKSSLVNTLTGDSEQQTGPIRTSDDKGRHTTTSRSLHWLESGGILLDTPGMRELQMADNEEGIRHTFADIKDLAYHCRYNDCQHQSEPGCAVLAAIENGALEQRRLDNYLKMIEEQLRNSRSLAERRQDDRALGRFYKTALASSKQFKQK